MTPLILVSFIFGVGAATGMGITCSLWAIALRRHLPKIEQEIREQIAGEVAACRCDQGGEFCGKCSCRVELVAILQGETP